MQQCILGQVPQRAVDGAQLIGLFTLCHVCHQVCNLRVLKTEFYTFNHIYM